MFRQLIRFIVIACVSTQALGLALTAQVDRATIASNESLRLIIAADELTNELIDFSELKHQFDIINTQKSSQQSIVNGKISANTQWILILSPKETGQLIIPSFELRGAYSPAIPITVARTDKTPSANNPAEVFLQASLDKNTVYVQEQVILTLRLYYKTSLTSYEGEDLKLDNTTIELIAENNFQTTSRGEKYQVLELIYALHPQNIGSLDIPAQSWRLERSLRSFGFGRSTNPYLYVKTEPLTVTVNPIPATSSATHWLPSTAVTLDADWQQSTIQAKVGEPLNLSLALTANGLTAAQLPTVTMPQTADFTVYSDRPDTSNSKSAAGVIGSRTSQFAIIPRQAGRFSFPEITLKWWNINSDKEETITLPAQTIVVAGSNLAATDTLPGTLPAPVSTTGVASSSRDTWLWQLISTALALACCLLGYLLYQSNRRALPIPKTDEVHNRMDEKPLLQAMEMACNDRHWGRLRQLLIQWGQFKTHNPSLESLEAVGREFPSLAPWLQQLDNQLYGKHSDNHWEPAQLIALIKTAKTPAGTTEKTLLKPLYQQ